MAGEEEDDVEEEEEEEGLPVSGLNVLSGAGALWNRELGFLESEGVGSDGGAAGNNHLAGGCSTSLEGDN